MLALGCVLACFFFLVTEQQQEQHQYKSRMVGVRINILFDKFSKEWELTESILNRDIYSVWGSLSVVFRFLGGNILLALCGSRVASHKGG